MNPLEQFTIKSFSWAEFSLAGYDVSFTNSAMWMSVVVLAVAVFVGGGMAKSSMVPGRWQAMVEMMYEFIAKLLNESAGPEARKFFPFVFTLFMFILFANLQGMIPGSFTVTSHIIVTFGLAAFVFLMVTLLGIWNHGFKFLKLFAPSGVPVPLYVLIVPIELVSYLSRPVSLSIRLFANMMGGHATLKVIASFVAPIAAVTFGIGALLPIFGLVALTALEFLIAALQAYVFALLTSMYLHDAYHVEH